MLAGFFIFATALAGYIIYASVRDFVADVNLPGGAGPGPISAGTSGGASPAGGEGAQAGVGPVPLTPWQGTDRVTVLVMGIDQRAGVETDTAYRTDSMMLLTIDPVSKKAGMLSIPRDLWVQIPGFEERDRINTANFKGDAYRLPGGGPRLAMQTVELNFGIRVHYYVRINFTAFERLVDEVGGIEVNVPQTIDDPLYPDCCFGYEPFHIDAGLQHMDGRTALKYARTRATFGGDFDRAERQQDVVMAVRDKVLSLDIRTLVGKGPTLYQTLAGSFDSNLTLEQMIALGLLATEVSRANIQTAVVDTNYILTPYTTSDGAQVVILDTFAFRELRDAMFYTPAPVVAVTTDPAELLASEAATIEVQNGTPEIGLAAATAEYLENHGFNVVSVNNADRFDYAATIIIDYSGRPYTTGWLRDRFRVQPASIFARNDPNSPVDVQVILGADFVLPTQ